MGNSSSTNSLWPPGKLFQRKSKQNSVKNRSSRHTNSRNAPPLGPMYDTVADDVPVYSVVDKSRQNNIKVEDNVQYADIEVIRKPTKRSQKKQALMPKPEDNTEYATIRFPPEHTSANMDKVPPQHSSANQYKASPQHTLTNQYKAPSQHTSAKQYKAPPQHTSTNKNRAPPHHTSPSRGHAASESPRNYTSSNGTLV